MKKKIIVVLLIILGTYIIFRGGINIYINSNPQVKYLITLKDRLKDIYGVNDVQLSIKRVNGDKYMLSSNNLKLLNDEEIYYRVLYIECEHNTYTPTNIEKGVLCGEDIYTWEGSGGNESYLKKNGEIVFTNYIESVSKEELQSQTNRLKYSLLSDDEKVSIAKQQVKKKLKNPSSAKFSDISINGDVVYGMVSGTNDFNATVSNSFAVTFDSEGGCTVDIW